MFTQKDIEAVSDKSFRFTEPRIDPAARQAKLEAVLEIANGSPDQPKRLSKFSIASARDDDASTYFTQIRAKPGKGFGGCEFRFNMPACDPFNMEVNHTAKELLEAAHLFLGIPAVGRYAILIRKAVLKILEPTTKDLFPVKLLAIGYVTNNASSPLAVDVEMLDRDLAMRMHRISGADIEHVEDKLAKEVAKHVFRAKLRCQATASRAIGWIDDAALRILDASGLSRSDAIAYLRRDRWVEFYFGGSDGYDLTAALYWEDGVIKGDVEDNKDAWRFEADMLVVHKTHIPETVLVAWPGRRFGDVIEHRFIPSDAIVTSVDGDPDGWLFVKLAIGNTLVDETAGLPRQLERVV